MIDGNCPKYHAAFLTTITFLALVADRESAAGEAPFSSFRNDSTDYDIETAAGDGRPGDVAIKSVDAHEAHVDLPFGVENGPDGALYITTVGSHRVLRLDRSSGKITSVAGNGRRGYSGDGAAATEATLNEPYEVRFDSQGNMVIVEMRNHLIRRVDAASGIISTLAGDGVAGDRGDGGEARQARFRNPHSLTIDRWDNIYVSDLSNHRVRVIDAGTGRISTIAGSGQRGFPKDGTLAATQPLTTPQGIAIHNGSLWIASFQGQVVWKVNLQTRRIRRVAGTGHKGYSGDGGDPLKATFDGPRGIAISPSGTVYVVEGENNIIRAIDSATGTIRTIAGAGPQQHRYSGDGVAALAAPLWQPHGICVNKDGTLVLSDTINHRVRRLRPTDSDSRHRRVARRRAEVQIICHRGAVEFAHENTLEAYLATFELGGDGNEIDIRATKDGVLVCFHDDMLDHLLEAYGDAADYTWEELRRFRFRNPGPYGSHCRIPTLAEVFSLHRTHGGLMHLDIKRPQLTSPVMTLLDRMDMWNHVVQAPAAISDPRLRRGRYKKSMYLDRSELNGAAIDDALGRPGDSVIVEDPRGVAVALGREIRRPSEAPVAPVPLQQDPPRHPPVAVLLELLHESDDWDQVASGEEAEAASAKRILRRARAADSLATLGAGTDEAMELLGERVRQRSLHRHWRYHGLDGAAALRSLIRLRAPQAVELARFCLWRDDPAIEPVVDPRWDNPRSWTDWRIKAVVFRELANQPGLDSQQLCRDYLALSDDAARQIGIPQFEAAARTLLAISPTKQTALELMVHRRGDVRGRAILVCLGHSKQRWAVEALETAAPDALAFRLP